MRTRSWILLAGLLVLFPMDLTGQEWADRARHWLTEAQARLLPDHGRPLFVIEGKIENYSRGFTGGHDFVLNRGIGRDFVFLGACDDDCRSMGLYVSNENGDEYDNDDGGDLPLVRVEQGTELDIEVRMHGCSNEPCYYALGLYALGRARGRDCPALGVASDASWVQTRLWDARFSEAIAEADHETPMGQEAFCFDVQPYRTYEIETDLGTLEARTLTLYDARGMELDRRYNRETATGSAYEPIRYYHDSDDSALLYVVVSNYQSLLTTGTYTLRVTGTR